MHVYHLPYIHTRRGRRVVDRVTAHGRAGAAIDTLRDLRHCRRWVTVLPSENNSTDGRILLQYDQAIA